MHEYLFMIALILIGAGVLLSGRNVLGWVVAFQIVRNNDQGLVRELAPTVAVTKPDNTLAKTAVKLLQKSKADE